MVINEETFNLYMMLKAKLHNYKEIENYVFNNSDKFDYVILKGFEKLISVKSNKAKHRHCKLIVQDMETLFAKKNINMVQLYIITQCKIDYWAIFTNLEKLNPVVRVMNILDLLKLHNDFYIEYAKEILCGKKMSNKYKYKYFNRMLNLLEKEEIDFFRKYRDLNFHKRCGESTNFFIQNMNDLIDYKLIKDKNNQH